MAEYYGNICTCRKCNGIVHTIRRGDTLYLLSRYYNVTINEIMRANSNINVYNLQVGDQICIPVRRPMPRTNISDQVNEQNQMQMNEVDESAEDDTNLQYMETSVAESSPIEDDERVEEVAAECCDGSKIKMSDLLKDENMTLDQFVKMIKDL